MAVKVGINGFAASAATYSAPLLATPEIEFVAVNDLTSPATLAHCSSTTRFWAT